MALRCEDKFASRKCPSNRRVCVIRQQSRHYATMLRGVTVDLIFRSRARRERVRRLLCQRQLLLQKRNEPQRCRKIFYRWKVQITLNFTSVTRSRRRIFIRARSVFSRWPTAGRKRACEN